MADRIDTTRRDAIKVGLAALAGLGVSALRPAPAFAGTDGDLTLGASNDAGSAETILTSSNAMYTLHIRNTNAGNGSALKVWQIDGASHAAAFEHYGSGPSIYSGQHGSGNAIEAMTTNAASGAATIRSKSSGTQGSALYGTSSSSHANARALVGEMTNAVATGWAIEAKTGGTGGGALWAQVASLGTGHAIRGSMFGTGPCTEAVIDNVTNTNPALTAHTNGTGLAVDAYTQGTGSVIKAENFNGANTSPVIKAVNAGTGYPLHAEGGKAQLYLKPAATAGAPTSGAHQLGEIYVDSTGKLFSCTAAGTPGTWTPVIYTPAAPTDPTFPSTITNATADQVLLIQQTGTGYALKAQGANALRVEGALSLSRSGRAKISKKKKSATVTVPSGISTTAGIVCTLQGSAGSGVYVRYAKRTSSTKFTIQLNKAATSTCYVAWMIIG